MDLCKQIQCDKMIRFKTFYGFNLELEIIFGIIFTFHDRVLCRYPIERTDCSKESNDEFYRWGHDLDPFAIQVLDNHDVTESFLLQRFVQKFAVL